MKPVPAISVVTESAPSAYALHEAAGVGLASLVEEFAVHVPVATSALWQRVRARCADVGPAVSRLIDDAEASDGGKHMRPRLVAAAFLGMGGVDRRLLAEVAGAQQLLHLGLCLHDDLIDGDRVRHGVPNLIGRSHDAALAAGAGGVAAERQALAAGLLAGDLTLNAALLALLDVPASLAVRHRLAVEATTELERTIAGELLDVQSETITPDRAAPLHVAELKTAAYSVVLPLRLGAVAAGCESEAILRCLTQVGVALGIAYQLADDDLGLFGVTEATGKSVLSDVRQGKRTEHIRIAYQRAGFADRATLDGVLGRPDATDADADLVREIVRRTGARESVTRTIDEYMSRGIRLADTALPDPLATYLADLARSMRGRRR
ncbi:polyprenyl synthetase family protein [Agromyces humatus]|uniref:Polyprenyl synthetase family protein n=1 Tax=Agromyces humatus TaxID=279573 RepID=A0ABN2KPN9_9MICO|nr:polyprenyl synthetase family protein [Agromyces humatus]